MHFNRFVGTTVFHCHILAHEDNGMMGIIDISRTGQLSEATVKSLEEMNKAMPQHSTGAGGSHTGHDGCRPADDQGTDRAGCRSPCQPAGARRAVR